MDVLKDRDFQELGIRETTESKTLIIGKEKIVLPVFAIPLDLLRYNKKNGRIFSQIYNLTHKENIDLDQLETKEFNDEIEALIWDSNTPKNISTKDSIETYGQLEPGVVITNGTVIDGNRRFTCIRRLGREKLENEEFAYFRAAILDIEDKNINAKDVRKYELTVQFGQEEKVDYTPLNKSLSIYDDIVNSGITIREMSDILKESTTSINKRVNTINLVNEFLDFINAVDDYQLAEVMSVYYALEPLAQYLPRIKSKFSETDIEERKRIYFSYLAGVKFELQTQTLRDRLIKKIFSEPKYYETFKKSFFENYADDVGKAFLENGKSETEDRHEAVKNFRSSETSKNMKVLFDRTVQNVEYKKNTEVPIEKLRGIIEQFDDLNLEPFINADAEKKLIQVKNLLDEIIDKAQKIKLDID